MILQNVVPWGRDLQEYEAMFSLRDEELRSNILGCGDGPSSFNAELTQKGGHVISIDPVYQFSAEELSIRIKETAEIVLKEVSDHKEDFVWSDIRDIDALKKRRLSAMKRFIKDFEQGRQEKRYFTASLPDLPFNDLQFDLVLCSHFLFLYSEHFDLAFHIDSIKAMCRVGKEVRVFPLLDLKGDKSAYLKPLIETLEHGGYRCEIEHVDYEFQKNGNEMLRITRSDGQRRIC